MLKDFSKEEFDIIIQAGQSNSEGCGVGDVENPYTPNDSIWYLNNDFWRKSEFGEMLLWVIIRCHLPENILRAAN